MQLDQHILLIYKDLKGEISPEEKILLDRYRTENKESLQVEEDIRTTWEAHLLTETALLSDLDAVNAKIDNLPKSSKIVPFWKRPASIAAAIILAIGAVLVFQMNLTDSQNSVFAEEDMVYTLPDNSVVNLARGSRLVFNKQFDQDRNLKLEGRAYFDVQRNEDLPFRIEVRNTFVEVLGTEFNINAFGENVEVAVTEGKVRFSYKDSEVILIEDEVGILKEASTIVKQSLHTSNFKYWTNDQFRFDEDKLSSVFQQLSTIFGIEIEIEQKEMEDCIISAVFNESKPIPLLTKIAEKFEMEIINEGSNRFTILNGACK